MCELECPNRTGRFKFIETHYAMGCMAQPHTKPYGVPHHKCRYCGFEWDEKPRVKWKEVKP